MDYTIHGDKIQYLEIKLSKNETIFGDIKSVVIKDMGIKMDTDYAQLLQGLIDKETYRFTEFKNIYDRSRKMIFSVDLCHEIKELNKNQSYYVNPKKVLCASDDLLLEEDFIYVRDMSLFLYSLNKIQVKEIDVDKSICVKRESLLAMTDSIKIDHKGRAAYTLQGPGHVWVSDYKKHLAS